MTNSIRVSFVRAFGLLGAAVLALTLASCGGGGTSSSNDTTNQWGALVYGQNNWQKTP